MRRILSVAFVASAMFAGAMFAAELKSGLQPGDAPPAYNVTDATGPSEGKKLCYRCKYGGRPVVNIFAREMTPEVVALVKEINEVVGKNEEKKMAAFVTVLTNDPDKEDAKLKAIAKKEGGADKLKGKHIALVYHDSPYGKEPIALLQERAKMQGYELSLLPVAHPGVEQKATWLQVRQSRPDYILLWGWGVMNSAALKEAVATGYPREKMFGVWWSAAEPDVKDVGEAAKGYTGLVATGEGGKVIADVKKFVHDKKQGTGPADEVGTTLYNRGLVSAALAVEGVRRAQERYGKGKVMNGDQIRWGLENLALDQKALNKLGLGTIMKPLSTSCVDHEGSRQARLHTWDGKAWNYSSDWMEADDTIIKPLVKQFADKYAAEKKLTRRSAADCQS